MSISVITIQKEYKGHRFIGLVDNTRTHTEAEFSVNGFGMKPGTRRPVDQVDYNDYNDGQDNKENTQDDDSDLRQRPETT
jgi:hypothetical protein